MKRFFATTILVCGLYFSGVTASVNSNATEETRRVEVIVNRIEEIRKIDLTELNKAERKVLKKELISLKKETKGLDLTKPVGLSLGAAIIIVLLIIIIL